MGFGNYSITDREIRSIRLGYDTKSTRDIFIEKSINNSMSPFNLEIRESRDSIEHPDSIPIILGLDVTGSMGSIPYYLVKEGFPNMMQNIIDAGIKDPQVLFLGIGDHTCDEAPIQVGQFESNDELLDKWLTSIYLEGGGGGNIGESYFLAWLIAANYTSIDSFEKRNKKGFLFTIGDEPCLDSISAKSLKNIFGEGQFQNINTMFEILDKVKEKYEVYHLHLIHHSKNYDIKVIDSWKQLLRDNLICIKNKKDVASTISEIVSKNKTTPKVEGNKKTEIIL